MNLRLAKESDARFEEYIAGLASALVHKDREGPFLDYSRGLIVTTGRKSVEPLAAITSPARVEPKHQSLLHFVGQSEWSDTDVLNKVREKVQPLMERHGPIKVSIVDD